MVCINVDVTGTAAFVETQDSSGAFWDVDVTDGGPGGSGDTLFFQGPFSTPICPVGAAGFGSPVTSGNIVVNQAG